MIANAPAVRPAPVIRAAARAFAVCWIAAAATGVVVQWMHELPRVSPAAILLCALGFAACARPLRLGSTLELSAAQPIAFAALLAWGTSTALAVGGFCVLGAVLLRRPGLGLLKACFNVAVGLGSVLGAGWVLALAGGGPGQSALTPQTLTALGFATLAAFPLATLPVAAAVSLHSSQPVWNLWTGRYVPTAPGFLVASGLALLLVIAAQQLGAASLLFYIPLAVLLFSRTLPVPAGAR